MCRTLICGLMLLAPCPLLGQDREIHPDVLQTYEARKALLRDPSLGPLNLGVRVKSRVAVLWGPVPSAAVAGQAVSLLEKLPGLIAVRNELEIDPELNFSPQYLPETLPESRVPKKPGNHLSPATLTTRSLDKKEADAQRRAKEPKAGEQSLPVVAVPPTTIPGMPDHREIEVVLPSLRIPVAEPEMAKNPTEAIAALQKDGRFAAIQVRLEAGLATVVGDANMSSSLYEFARLVSRIPGINRVVVQERE